ncbi:MAG: hypothetical protein IJK01_07715 [Clostridia bacterium]|jgi:hypothetical protein|nr:hypothetical protein [Clostridia bacterium]
MRIRSSICPIKTVALVLIALGLLLLLFCVPFWVFCAALALVLIVLGFWLL